VLAARLALSDKLYFDRHLALMTKSRASINNVDLQHFKIISELQIVIEASTAVRGDLHNPAPFAFQIKLEQSNPVTQTKNNLICVLYLIPVPIHESLRSNNLHFVHKNWGTIRHVLCNSDEQAKGSIPVSKARLFLAESFFFISRGAGARQRKLPWNKFASSSHLSSYIMQVSCYSWRRYCTKTSPPSQCNLEMVSCINTIFYFHETKTTEITNEQTDTLQISQCLDNNIIGLGL
jgi:hypothetical protein